MSSTSKRQDPDDTLVSDEIDSKEADAASEPTERRAFHSQAPRPGEILAGKYEVEQVLGVGGMAVVAAAYHLQLHRRVAIKYLLPEALDYPESVERFTREARVAARMRGEHVARVIDLGILEGGAPFIVLEYLDGMDLSRLLKKVGRLSIADAVSYILETCEALAEAHAVNIVHRDLKPANLFLAKGPDRRSTIKVLDFGVSKIMDEPMTDGARVVGTLGYMSPEQLRASSEVDLRTDLWSLGVILYELLTGEAPFAGATMLELSNAVLANTPEPLRSRRPEVPIRLEGVVERCLRSDPADRYASVLDLAIELAPFGRRPTKDSVRTIRGVLHGGGSIPPPPSTPVPSTPLRLPPPPIIASVTIPAPPLSSEAPLSASIRPRDASDDKVRAPEPSRRRSWASWGGPLLLVPALFAIGAALLSGTPKVAHHDTHALPSAPSEVLVRIVNASTLDAEVRIDDGPYAPLPIVRSVPRDDGEHTIYLRAPGRPVRERKVSFRTDVVLVLSPLED